MRQIIATIWVPMWKMCSALQHQGRLGAPPWEFVVGRLTSQVSADSAWSVCITQQRATHHRQTKRKGLLQLTRQVAKPCNGQQRCQLSSNCLTLSIEKQEENGDYWILMQCSMRWWKWRGKIFHMILACSAWQRKLVVCCQIPSAKFVKGRKTSVGWGKSVSSNSSISPPALMIQGTQGTPGPPSPPLFTSVGAGGQGKDPTGKLKVVCQPSSLLWIHF